MKSFSKEVMERASREAMPNVPVMMCCLCSAYAITTRTRTRWISRWPGSVPAPAVVGHRHELFMTGNGRPSRKKR